MQLKFILLLLLCTFYNTKSRSLQQDETESDIDEFDSEDDNEIAVDESNPENSNDFLKQDSASDDEQELNQGERFPTSDQEPNPDGSNVIETDANLFSDTKGIHDRDANDEKYSDILNTVGKMESPTNTLSNRYTENNDLNQQLEPIQYFNKHNVKNYKASRLRNIHENLRNKKTIQSNVDQNIKYENDNIQMNYDGGKYRINNKDNEQGRSRRHHYDTVQSENMLIDGNNQRAILNRDRRHTPEIKQNSEELSDTKNEYLLNTDKVDDEAAIKQHIKKLSDVELEELLNSLNEEKRALLKKIIDDDNSDNGVREIINKREITKKAGAVEDNGFIESVQSDTNKLQGSSPSADVNTESSGSHKTDKTKLTNKQSSEKVDESTSKTSETNFGVENNLSSYESGNDAKNNVEVASNINTPTKSDTKREANLDDIEKNSISFEDNNHLENDYNDKNLHMSFGDEYNVCAQDENIQINDNLAQSHNEKSYKREVTVNQNEMFDAVKALEESFPNSQASDNSVSYCEPLIRVKRTDLSNHNITKIQAEILPDNTVQYYPNRAENLDEDYKEGNEFNDDGVSEDTANFKTENKLIEDASHNYLCTSERIIDANENFKTDGSNQISNYDNNKGQIVKLGSDTDSVLSGVEGVDENLMFNSNSRSKRTLEMNRNKK